MKRQSLFNPCILIVALSLAVGIVSCEKGGPVCYQGIAVATSYSYDLSGRTDRIKGYVVKIDNLKRIPEPGLVFLAQGLDTAGEGYVTVNDNRYEITPIGGDLLGKIVIPLDTAHLSNGINEIEFYMSPGGDGFEVPDCRLESVKEKSAVVTGRTYRVVTRGRTISIDDFNFIIEYSGEGIRNRTEVPEWTQRGKARFYRGGINFDRLDRMFEMFREAHVNLVMLRVPADRNSDRYKQVKDFIDKCHAEGIRITSSFSLGGISLREALMEPDLLKWVSLDEYGERRWRRRGGTYLADLKNKGYKKEMLRVAQAAIDADADELYYDWAIGGTGEVIEFFSDVRGLAAARGRNVSIYGNCKGNILVDMVCDITKSEGTGEAGVWNGKWVHNVAQSRFYYAVGDGWKPYRSKYEGANPGEPHPKAYDIRDGMKRGWKRPIAEANAFQSHFAIAETGSKLRDGWIFENNELAMEIWGEICRYNGFLAENEELYTDVRVLSRIGVLAPPRVPSYEYKVARGPLYDALAEMSMMYDVLLLPRINDEMLAKYKAIVLADLPYLTQDQLKVIENYRRGGGKLYVIGSSDELRRLADVYVPSSIVRDIGQAGPRSRLLRDLGKLSGGPLIGLQGADYVIANVVKKTDSDRVIVHFINYSKPVKNLRVSIDLEGFVDNIEKPRLESPDDVPKRLSNVSVRGNKASFVLPELDIYDVIVMN